MNPRWLLITLLLAAFTGTTMPDATAQSDVSETPEGFDLQGHRGARGLVPENTIPAFRRALELGVTTLEMDVVIAGDGTVVVSHEPWMAREKCLAPDGSRISGGEKAHNIYKMAYSEIEEYDCGKLVLSEFPEQAVSSAPKPRLEEVFQMAESYVEEHGRDRIFYNVEVKSRPDWDDTFHPDPETFVRRVLGVVEKMGVAPRTTIQSFDTRALEAAHEQNSAVRTALLVGWMDDDGFKDNLAELSFQPDIYSPTARLVDEDLVESVHERGLLLIPWTVNEPTAMKSLIRMGVDGLITDYPDRAQAVLPSMEP